MVRYRSKALTLRIITALDIKSPINALQSSFLNEIKSFNGIRGTTELKGTCLQTRFPDCVLHLAILRRVDAEAAIRCAVAMNVPDLNAEELQKSSGQTRDPEKHKRKTVNPLDN